MIQFTIKFPNLRDDGAIVLQYKDKKTAYRAGDELSKQGANVRFSALDECCVYVFMQ